MKAQPGARIEPRTEDSQVTKRLAEGSPRLMARIAVVLYLLEGTGAVFGQFFVHGRFVVAGDAAATATNILANEPLFLLGFASALIAVAFHLAYTVIFYNLFRPVSRSFSFLAASVSLVACALQAFSSLFQLAPVFVLGGDHSLRVFTVKQLQALALLLLNVNHQAFNIYLVFFAFWLLLIGYLIFRSTFMPRMIGVLLALAGLSYMPFLYPPLINSLLTSIEVVDGVGEVSLLLWLLIVGVNAERWKEQASKAWEADQSMPGRVAV